MQVIRELPVVAPLLDFAEAKRLLLKAVEDFGDLTYTQRMKVLGWKSDLKTSVDDDAYLLDTSTTTYDGNKGKPKCVYIMDTKIGDAYVQAPACLIGVVLHDYLHVDKNLLSQHNSTGISALIRDIDVDAYSGITPEAKDLLTQAQSSQDAGQSWANAVQTAIDVVCRDYGLLPDGSKMPSGVTADPWATTYDEDAGFAESPSDDEPPF